MWLIIFAVIMLSAAGSIAYLISGFHRFSFISGIKNKWLSWSAATVIVVAVAIPWLCVNVWAMAVVMIHLFVFWVIADAIAKIMNKKTEKNYPGACAVIFTAVYLAFGWYTAHHVVITNYELTTNKNIGGENLRVAMFADSHMGITFDGEKFAEYMQQLTEQKPDVVIIAGDFVDDYSNRADMIRACEAVGGLNTKYGVYFAFGNHDKGYFEGSRDFSESDLRTELTKNGVVILEDESVMIDENICIIGRQDAYVENRKKFSEISGKNIDNYNIVIDHQPSDYDSIACSVLADLVLSGHTHGGHIFPTGLIGLIIGANDRVYGSEQREWLGQQENFIVTSGISGWAIPFKTGTKSEMLIIDIKKAS